jgi:hypothetical protein
MTSDEYLPDEEYHAEIGAELERTIRATQREFGVGSDDVIDAAIIIDLLRVAGSHLAGDAAGELFAWADHVDAVNIGGRPLPRGIARPAVPDPARKDSAPALTYNDALAFVNDLAAGVRKTARTEIKDPKTRTLLYEQAAHVDDVATHLETQKRLHKDGRNAAAERDELDFRSVPDPHADYLDESEGDHNCGPGCPSPCPQDDDDPRGWQG